MLKTSFLVVTFISFLIPLTIMGQDSNSLQFTGGIISPMSSSRGLTGNVQFNYVLNSNVIFYISSGYSSWNYYFIIFHEDFSPVQHQQYFRKAAASDHYMIPLYVGSRINFHTIKLFTSFIEFEAGYSYLHFNSYDFRKVIIPETGEVLDYAQISKTKNSENLFGIGIGAGISHPITDNFSLILEFKLNSHITSNYPGLFSTRGTYTRFTAGFNFNI